MLVKFDGGKFLATRKAKNLSQAKVAATADTTVRYVRDMEKGKKNNPSAAMVYRLSAALEVPMEALMTVQQEGE